MNLGVIEDHVLRMLSARFGDRVRISAGPPVVGPRTGVQPEVFVHAGRFVDHGGVMPDGARVGRRAISVGARAAGFAEERPATIELAVVCVAGQHGQANAMASVAAPQTLFALETLQAPLLSDPSEKFKTLRFADHVAHLHEVTTSLAEQGEVVAAEATLTFHIEGFIHVHVTQAGGLVRTSVHAVNLRLEIEPPAAPRDPRREHVTVHNVSGGTIDLGGWTLLDAAPRPRRFTFPASRRVAPGAALRVWSGRGTDDVGNIFLARRTALWIKPGDVAILRDPDGVERAQAKVGSASRPVAPRDKSPKKERNRRKD